MVLYTGLDKCEENLQYPMLETQLNLEYVENLHLATVLSGDGTVVR